MRQLPDLEEGDWLVFDRMGAYTNSIAGWTEEAAVVYLKDE